MKILKAFSQFLLALFLTLAGILHFVKGEVFARIVPPYLLWPWTLVYLSGFFEILLGITLLVPRLSRTAAWGIIALLIAVFPANIYLFQNQELLPAPAWVHAVRLPLQAVFIAWAYWHTRPSPSPLQK